MSTQLTTRKHTAASVISNNPAERPQIGYSKNETTHNRTSIKLTDQTYVEETVPKQAENSPSAGTALAGPITRYWGEAVVIALALLLWLPRLSGPIDLRWDGGVYYLLGSSLSQGHGYRIASEPGSPEALQYPPLLPATVALHQWALGTTDAAAVAPWLRKSYAVLFVGYAVAILALARRYLQPGLAVAATALSLLQVKTIFMSDVLFADIPLALVSVLFTVVATGGALRSRPWLRETALFALAAAAFLFRTAGLAILAAWVLAALVQRRWRLTIIRSVLALLPVLGWQAHVLRVHGSYEYTHPAYEYQRAPYQYYNVSYAENVRLVDPFRPELGQLDSLGLLRRVVANVPSMMTAVGETVSTNKEYWLQMVDRAQARVFHRIIIPERIVSVPLLLLAALALIGLITFVQRGAWLMVFIVLGSLGLACTTPWPAQFARYLVALTPFLVICALFGVLQVRRLLVDHDTWFGSTGERLVANGLLLSIFGIQIFPALKLFQQRWSEPAVSLGQDAQRTSVHLFYPEPAWEQWDETAKWIKTHARPGEIVATVAPHMFYLQTGVHAVLPPMEIEPERARRLFDEVPVSYVIIDQLKFLDISRRYAAPAVDSDLTHWRLVHSIDGTNTYARINTGE
jgi:hypothetical protein